MASLPKAMACLPQEWDDGEYPSTEVLQVGRKKLGQMIIHLPVDIWLPRGRVVGQRVVIDSACIKPINKFVPYCL